MNNILNEILRVKYKEVEDKKEIYKNFDWSELLKSPSNAFKKALKKKEMGVIAEVKRRSPSAGEIALIDDPDRLVKLYLQGGASAISILTDHPFFGGSMEDMKKVSAQFPLLLMKDFIADPVQIAEGALFGASAVLLIVAVLGKKTPGMLSKARSFGLEVVIEVHDAEELELALDSGAEIIGVNNRDLRTFEVDLKIAERLAPLIPDTVVKISESGIRTAEDAHFLRNCGYDAILVGEALVRSKDPAQLIRSFRK
jgi:indole-3-glycerol phosphate synthase